MPFPKRALAATTSPKAFRATIRMYRQGLGDCFLLAFPRDSGGPFRVLIDCGVILGTKTPSDIMTEVVEDIVTVTNGHIDLLISTHEHWDHLSGFLQATASFQKLKVDEVWFAWTEDPKDELANKLHGERTAMAAALGVAENRMRFGGAAGGADEIHGLLEFFGAAGSTTGDALKLVHGMAPKTRYCLPSDPMTPLPGTGVKSYVLGPPHDEKQIKRFNPSKTQPETYGMDSMNAFMSSVLPAILTDANDEGQPFDAQFQIPLTLARQVPFFQDRYFGEDAEAAQKDQSWRAIDTSFLDSSSTFALQLDSATNNTSLVVAFQLDGGDVLLFAADAQVGNWLSWQDLTWKLAGGTTETGPGLLNKTLVYKVGHHGSHNATLREKGLEEMTNLKTALIPVDHDMALKKGWGAMPLTELYDRLNEKTGNRVVRIDQPLPKALAHEAIETPLYFELTVS